MSIPAGDWSAINLSLVWESSWRIGQATLGDKGFKAFAGASGRQPSCKSIGRIQLHGLFKVPARSSSAERRLPQTIVRGVIQIGGRDDP
jgi:hypothetical protein